MTYPLTKELGRLVAGTRDADIPAEVAEKVCFAIADTVGVMVAGRLEPAPTLLRAMLSSAGTESSVIVDGARASALDAAWINGTAAHALDYDDVAQQGGHASAVLVPAILAEAEATGASGRDVIRAYAVGYEVFSALASRDADQHHNKGWHPTGIFGAIGAAAACAALRRLDADKAAMSIALAASQSSGLMSNFGTMTKPFHAGRAAHAGVSSARLAGLGFTAAMDAIEHSPGFLEAVSPKGRVDLDTPLPAKGMWAIAGSNRLAVKKYPMCYCTHRVIDGALRLKRENNINDDEIEWIKVSISPRNLTILRNHAPQTGLEAKFSIEFAAASALSIARAGLAELRDEFVGGQKIQALMRRVSIEEETRGDPARPGYAIYDQVRVGLRNGATLESGPITNVSGDPERPLAQGELWTKFQDCVMAGARAVDAEQLFSSVLGLNHPGKLERVFSTLRAGISGKA